MHLWRALRKAVEGWSVWQDQAFAWGLSSHRSAPDNIVRRGLGYICLYEALETLQRMNSRKNLRDC